MLMKAMLVGCVVSCVSTSALATTYIYTGADFSTVSADVCSACGFVPFPLSVADFTALVLNTYGDRLIGSVTFDADTSAATGMFHSNNYSFTTRDIHIDPRGPSGTFQMSFVDGNITAWNFNSNIIPDNCGDFNIVCNSGGFVTMNSDRGDRVSSFTGFTGYSSIARNETPGTWSAVPAPVAGAGLPGLLLASLGWLGWRRRTRQHNGPSRGRLYDARRSLRFGRPAFPSSTRSLKLTEDNFQRPQLAIRDEGVDDPALLQKPSLLHRAW